MVRDDEWAAFRLAGTFEFSLIGILMRISAVLAEAGVGIFAVSTFDTDYVLIKKDNEGKVLYLELGVGANTPVIINYPFWEATGTNPDSAYACANMGEACAPSKIEGRSILIDGDIRDVLTL